MTVGWLLVRLYDDVACAGIDPIRFYDYEADANEALRTLVDTYNAANRERWQMRGYTASQWKEDSCPNDSQGYAVIEVPFTRG